VSSKSNSELPNEPVCLCCLEELHSKQEYVSLQECSHELCQECFLLWRRIKNTCPMCRAQISTVAVFARQLETHNPAADFPEEVTAGNSDVSLRKYRKVREDNFEVAEERSENAADLSCLDHSYFAEELERLRRVLFDVKRERFEIRGAKGTDHEWSVLQQVEGQLESTCIQNDNLVQFDANQRLYDIYTMAETLFKIKSGKLIDSHEEDDDTTYFRFDISQSITTRNTRDRSRRERRNKKKIVVVSG